MGPFDGCDNLGIAHVRGLGSPGSEPTKSHSKLASTPPGLTPPRLPSMVGSVYRLPDHGPGVGPRSNGRPGTSRIEDLVGKDALAFQDPLEPYPSCHGRRVQSALAVQDPSSIPPGIAFFGIQNVGPHHFIL